MGDFILGTDKHNCFLCSVSVQTKSLLVRCVSSATHSIQYLSRYLEMDMKKVFNEEGPIVPELLAKVKKAKLKVELCKECTSLNQTFSNLYRKLEKIDLEVKSCLSLIQKKFMKAKETTKSDAKDDFNGRTQIVDNLRKDGMQKCAAKLCKVSPRLTVQKLTREQVDRRKRELKTIAQQSKFAVAEAVQTSDSMTNYNNDDCYMEYSDEMETEAFEQPTTKFAHADAEEVQPIILEKGKVKKESGSTGSVSIPTEAVTFSQSKPVEKKYTRNPLTGKYKCMLCSMEFNQDYSARHHYNIVHLKVKFKCKLCGKEFTRNDDVKRHHKSVHIGVRFKCLGCNKEFSYKTNLTAHQQNTNCESELHIHPHKE